MHPKSDRGPLGKTHEVASESSEVLREDRFEIRASNNDDDNDADADDDENDPIPGLQGSRLRVLC